MKNSEMSVKEIHPLPPFLPRGALMLILGSFPPPRERWSMEFFYPNMQNDMWRIFGLVFFGDKEYFVTEATVEGKTKKIFSRERLREFLTRKKIALGDTAQAVVRHQGNASDKFLEIVEPVDLNALLSEIPDCAFVVTTGDKATSILCLLTGTAEPKIGEYSVFDHCDTAIRHYRMPSSSRAYPLALDLKAAAYEKMFRETGLL